MGRTARTITWFSDYYFHDDTGTKIDGKWKTKRERDQNQM